MCLAICVVDKDDPSYSEELMQNLNIPTLRLTRELKENEEFTAIVMGYPLEIFKMDQGGHWFDNEKLQPFYCEGKMVMKV